MCAVPFSVHHFCRSVGQPGCRWNCTNLSRARVPIRVCDISDSSGTLAAVAARQAWQIGFGAGSRSPQRVNVEAQPESKICDEFLKNEREKNFCDVENKFTGIQDLLAEDAF